MAENETPKVGDTVYGDLSHFQRVDIREGKVVKVTPTGRINVDFGALKGIQFKDGWQVGGDMWHKYRLIDRETYDRLLAEQQEQRAVVKLAEVLRSGFATKAEALALADRIKALAEAIPDSYGA